MGLIGLRTRRFEQKPANRCPPDLDSSRSQLPAGPIPMVPQASADAGVKKGDLESQRFIPARRLPEVMPPVKASRAPTGPALAFSHVLPHGEKPDKRLRFLLRACPFQDRLFPAARAPRSDSSTSRASRSIRDICSMPAASLSCAPRPRVTRAVLPVSDDPPVPDSPQARSERIGDVLFDGKVPADTLFSKREVHGGPPADRPGITLITPET